VTASEAARQYQVALEHERRGRTELGGVVSGLDDLDAAAGDTARAWEVLDGAIRAEHIHRLEQAFDQTKEQHP